MINARENILCVPLSMLYSVYLAWACNGEMQTKSIHPGRRFVTISASVKGLKENPEDFFNFLSDLKAKSMKGIDPTITITMAKTFYEITSALIMAYILGFILIGTIGFMIFGETKKDPNY